MLTLELLERYKKQNPRKYEEKLRKGEFDEILGRQTEETPVNPLIVEPPQEDASGKKCKCKHTRTKKSKSAKKRKKADETDNRDSVERGEKVEKKEN